MKRLVPGICAALIAGGLSALTARTAHAAPPASEQTVQLAPPDEKTCVAESELRGALEKAGVTVAPSNAAPSAGVVQVAVRGTPERLVVVTAGEGRDGTATLPAASCQTATDLTAAFLISTLAPAPALPSTAPALPRLQAATLEQAIRDEFKRQGLQLSAFDALLFVQRDRSDTWFARVQAKEDPTVTQTIALGNFDDPSPARLASIFEPIADALRNVSVRAQLAPRSVRQTALLHALDDEALISSAMTGLAVGELAVGGTALLVLIPGHAPNGHFSFADASDGFASAGASMAVLGGAASFLVDDDYRASVVEVSGLMAMGAGFTCVAASGEQTVPKVSGIALSAGSYGAAVFSGLNALMWRPPVSRLRTARRRLAARSASSAEMDGVERDLAALDPPIPAFVSYSPLIAGGAVALLPEFAHGFASEGRSVAAAFAVAMLGFGTMGALIPSSYSRYQNELRNSGISDIALGPALGPVRGVSLSGRF